MGTDQSKVLINIEISTINRGGPFLGRGAEPADIGYLVYLHTDSLVRPHF
jgi:hypothetical protein